MPFVITRFPPILGESPHSDWNVPRMLDDITRLLDINVTYHISIHFFILGACVLFFCVLRKMHILYIIFTHIHIYIYTHVCAFRTGKSIQSQHALERGSPHCQKVIFSGMLLTSILALKSAPMSLVIVLRNTSPFGTLVFERFYPEPLRISSQMLAAIVT